MSQETENVVSPSPSSPSTSHSDRGHRQQPSTDQMPSRVRQKASTRLKERNNSRLRVEDQLLHEAVMALKSSQTPQQNLDREEVDQDMLYGKWLGGELKQIKDPKMKQWIKIKIQNILFEVQFDESALENPQQQNLTSNFGASNTGSPSPMPQQSGWQTPGFNMGNSYQPTYTSL